MGHEFSGICEKAYSSIRAKRVLVGRFSALQWKIVRERELCLGVAVFGPRNPKSWDEDFMVCVHEDHIYVVIYSSSERLIMGAIGDALRLVAGRVDWEEL